MISSEARVRLTSMLLVAASVLPAAADTESALGELRAALKDQQAQIDRLQKTVATQNQLIDRLGATAAVEAAKKQPDAKRDPGPAASPQPPPPKKWYDRLRLQGYTQIRHTSLLDGDPTITHDGDPSIRPNSSLLIRRSRLIFLGDLSERVFLYVQPDIATTPPNADGALHFAQLRDAYVDVFLDADKELRLRLGQSKVPYSFEALQSSQNRLAVERNDAINSATSQERDLGALMYWAPKEKRELFVHLRNNKLKGSGDYGVVGLGVVNGQGNNRQEGNENVHAVARVTWPHRFPNGQIVEGGVAAYSGKFVPRTSTVRAGARDVAIGRGPAGGFTDQRVNAHAVWYAQPFGLQAEYNVGRGPELDLTRLALSEEHLHGGYVQASYCIESGKSTLFPFVKYQKYDGAKKFELNAPPSRVREWDLGVEWQPAAEYEVVLQYKDTHRSDTFTFPYVRKRADLFQMHFQVNY